MLLSTDFEVRCYQLDIHIQTGDELDPQQTSNY